jgi:hypothetical protein
MTLSRIGVKRADLGPWVEDSAEPLPALFKRADAVVYVAPTTIYWDALLSGLPVFRYQSSLLDLDSPHPIPEDLMPTCTSGFAELLSLAPPPTIPEAERGRLLRRTFGPVDEDVWLRVCTAA